MLDTSGSNGQENQQQLFWEYLEVVGTLSNKKMKYELQETGSLEPG